ncbi:hypothetical protein [Thiothrix lacustris]|uniref:hypothetical protein n=1 Tax=Thiothrix lacustris TaxID=525917 RepID=UPI0027E4DEFA|nr:hypothetical protein [Thiothrix lacustris]WMP18159.1 hypothetical protein RCS87_03625 [Thiothrix lacustris]
MKQTNADYTFGIASMEIVLLLLGAFLLGMLLCSLLRKMGICCTTRNSNTQQAPIPLSTATATLTNTQEGGRIPREFPSSQLKSGGYTADINSLLRARDPAPSSTPNATDSSAALATGMFTNHDDVIHRDDLKKLEGIGPKLEQALNAAGIKNFAQLSSMSPEEIRPILDNAGNQFKMHDPKSWPYQAELANKGEWERLKEYQNLLINGHL